MACGGGFRNARGFVPAGRLPGRDILVVTMTASIVKLAATALAALPIKYLATLLGVDNETVLRWFILVVALLLDPGRGAPAARGDAGPMIAVKSLVSGRSAASPVPSQDWPRPNDALVLRFLLPGTTFAPRLRPHGI